MSEYAKKKNDELAALCKERGLPHTGKKADLVKRLEDHDAGSDGVASQTEKPAAEAPAATKPSTQKSEVESTTQPTDSTAKAETAPDASTEIKAESSAESFALGLQARTLDEEIARRKKRAEKFGTDISKDETLKQLERAKRFGTDDVPGLLNQALPERAEKKKRGREGGAEQGDRKRSRQRGNEDRPKKESKEVKPNGQASWMTDKDREAAERRKARFATTAE